LIEVLVCIFFLGVATLVVFKVRNHVTASDERLLEKEIEDDFKEEFNIDRNPNESFLKWIETSKDD